jgi:cell fate regulator YaaT (PSP1 superfamily)
MTDEGPVDDGPDDGPDEAPEAAGGDTPAGGEQRRKRRRRRRGRGERGEAPGGQPQQQGTAPTAEAARPSGAAIDEGWDDAPAAAPAAAAPSEGRPEGSRDRGAPGGGGNPGDTRVNERGRRRRGGRGGERQGGQHRGAQVGENRGAQAGDDRAQAGDDRAQAGDDRAQATGGRGPDNRGPDNRGGRGPENRGARGPDNRGPDNRGGRGPDNRGARGGDNRGGRGGERGGRGPDNRGARGGGGRGGEDQLAPQDATNEPASSTLVTLPSMPAMSTGSMPRLDARRGAGDDLDDAPPVEAAQWGMDDDGPPRAVELVPDLPVDAPADDPDPLSFPLVDGAGATLGDDVASVVGVRFMPGGRLSWFDAGESDYAVGDRVLVDSDRGQRLGVVGAPPSRRPVRERGLRRVIRRANDHDLRGERDGDSDRMAALRIAKDKAAALRLPLKVFRVELSGPIGRGGKANVYYTSDERLDMRELIRDLGNALSARIELRQLGVRDEAKAVGGIGSCGLTLCCTTWLPDFVPVSIKMAKDQGLVLSPTKVSGQCGRLKCCLVYEQAGYAELRKGEGRVVEVDVLRQRVRVSYGPGDTEVLPATEVKPLFPPGTQPPRGPGRPSQQHPVPDDEDLTDPSEATDDPSALVNADMQPSFVGGAPSPLDIDEVAPDTSALSEAVAEANDSIDEALRDVPDDDQVDPSSDETT